MTMFSFYISLRDMDVEVVGELCPAEPDVGIMTPYPEWFDVTDDDNVELILTEEENKAIYQLICENAMERSDD